MLVRPWKAAAGSAAGSLDATGDRTGRPGTGSATPFGLTGFARSVLIVNARDGLLERGPVERGNSNDRISSLAMSIDRFGTIDSEGTRGVASASSAAWTELSTASSGGLTPMAAADEVLAVTSSSLPRLSSASFLSLIISRKPEASPSPPDGEMARSSSCGTSAGNKRPVGDGGVVGDVGLVRPRMDAPTSVAGLSGRECSGVGGEIGIETDVRTGRSDASEGGVSTSVSGRRGFQAERGGVLPGRGGEDGSCEIGRGGSGSCVVGANAGGSRLIRLDSRFPFLPESDPDSNVYSGSYMDARA